MTDIRQAPEYAHFLHALGWKTASHKNGYRAAIKQLLPLFGILKLQRVLLATIDFDWIQKMARKHLVFVNYIELVDRLVVPIDTPFNGTTVAAFYKQASLELKRKGYSSVSHGMLPSKTQIIDLTQPLEKLVKGMKPKTRYNIGLAMRKKLVISLVSTNEFLSNQKLMEQIDSLLQKNARRAGYWVEGNNWIQKKLRAFDRKAFLLTAHSPDEPHKLLAVAFFLHSKDTLFYWVNGSTVEGRKLFAPSLLIYEALSEAKKRGLREFDFDGVYDERFPNKRWLGYTRFKQGFGGNYVFYPPCYIKRFALVR